MEKGSFFAFVCLDSNMFRHFPNFGDKVFFLYNGFLIFLIHQKICKEELSSFKISLTIQFSIFHFSFWGFSSPSQHVVVVSSEIPHLPAYKLLRA